MNLTTQFEYEKLSRIIDECEDIEALKVQTKNLLRLYFTHKETSTQLLLQRI